MQPSEISIFIVFLAGVVTIMKPCCLPLVPVIFSGSGGHRLRPLAIVSGLTISFTAMGVLVQHLALHLQDILIIYATLRSCS